MTTDGITGVNSKRLTGSLAARRSFALRFSERKLLLVIMDLVALHLVLYFGLIIQPASASILDRILPRYLLWSLVLTTLWLIIAFLLQLYDLRRAARALHSSWVAGWAALLTMGIYQMIPYITPMLPQRRLYIFTFSVLAPLVIMLWRFLYARVLAQSAFQQRLLIVGAGQSGRSLVEAIRHNTDNPNSPMAGNAYRVLGYVDDDPIKQVQPMDHSPVLGTRRDLIALVRRLRPDEVVIAITDPQTIHPELFRAILHCRELGVHLSTMTSLYEQLTGRVPVQHAGRDLHVVLPIERPATDRLYLGLRRLVEVLVACLGCLVVLLLIPPVWLLNRFSSPGDIFYRQARLGKGGSIFHLIKFRSMMMDAEKETGAVWAQENDERVTPAGRFLRKPRLDELPQFWNVLCGEMSLIGPRPERPEFVQELAETIPFYRVRHAVKPGITGWAQVNYSYGASENDALVKLQYDLFYIKNLGPYLDLKILLQTVQVMLSLRGR